jgi:two-component system NtrC family sensor kinase
LAGETILLVEDARDTREFLVEKILIPQGYHVLTAADGNEALAIALEQSVDLIIADYLMPQMTGLALLEELKRRGVYTPFILITAEGSESLAVRAMRLGVRDYIIKPFDIDYFLDAVAQVLAVDLPIGQPILEMLHLANDPILITDRDNHFLFANQVAKELFNLNDPIPRGISLRDLVTHADLLAMFEDTDTRPRYEIDIRRDVGHVILNAHLTLIPDLGKIAIMQDVTRLKEADRAKSEFVTSISHDLRTPLTAIMGYIELLERVGPLTEQQRKFKENVQFSVRSITALLTDLLELSKVETGFHDALQPTQVDIIVRYAIETNRTQLETKGQRLTVDLQDNLAPVLGNPIRLKQVASNLVQNAIKYTPSGGSIDVRLYGEGEFIILQVSDTGIGIAPEDQHRIWEKFYRTKEAAANFEGTGLGLSIVKGIVDVHGGRIWVESVPNEGSTFIVMLPAYREPV